MANLEGFDRETFKILSIGGGGYLVSNKKVLNAKPPIENVLKIRMKNSE